MMIHANGLGVNVDGRPLLTEISLELRAGEVLGIIGPNGAGKSTLLRALAGFLRPSSGAVRVRDTSLHAIRARHRASHVAYVAQDTGVATDITALDLVLMGRYAKGAAFRRSAADDLEAARRALDSVGMSHLESRPIPDLSGGERQLIQIARALAQGAHTLLLDEPTSALDIHHQLRVFELMREIAFSGHAVAAVLHDLNDAARCCDRIAVVDRGTLVTVGPPAQVLTSRLISEVYRVKAAVHWDERGRPSVCPMRALPARTEHLPTTQKTRK